jgi:hypothetical protein
MRRTIGNRLGRARATIPHFAHRNRTVVRDPLRRMGQRVRQAMDLFVPGSEVEVEVMQPVAHLRKPTKRRGDETRGEGAGDEARGGVHWAMVPNGAADGNPHPEVTIR